MKIILILLSIIGLLKLVSLFILVIIELYYYRKHKYINHIIKEYGIYKDNMLYITPYIAISKCGKYLEVMAGWLWLQYYCAYKIDKDESSSV